MGIPRLHSTNSSVLDAYPVRIMLGLVASLSLLLAIVRLPLQTTVPRVGWSTHPSTQQIILDDVVPDPPEDARAAEPEDAPPATDFQAPPSEQQARRASAETSAPKSDSNDSERLSEYTEIQSVDALSVEDRPPALWAAWAACTSTSTIRKRPVFKASKANWISNSQSSATEASRTWRSEVGQRKNITVSQPCRGASQVS